MSRLFTILTMIATLFSTLPAEEIPEEGISIVVEVKTTGGGEVTTEIDFLNPYREAENAIEETEATEVEEVEEATEATEVEEVVETTEATVAEEYVEEKIPEPTEWQGEVLTVRKGYTQGPSGKETWYDLEMAGVVKIMRQQGYSEEDYPYWVREDGCKMFGPYIMVAGDIRNTRNRGDIVETSLGTAMVCDHCAWAEWYNHNQLDIATDWAHTYSIRK